MENVRAISRFPNALTVLPVFQANHAMVILQQAKIVTPKIGGQYGIVTGLDNRLKKKYSVWIS